MKKRLIAVLCITLEMVAVFAGSHQVQLDDGKWGVVDDAGWHIIFSNESFQEPYIGTYGIGDSIYTLAMEKSELLKGTPEYVFLKASLENEFSKVFKALFLTLGVDFNGFCTITPDSYTVGLLELPYRVDPETREIYVTPVNSRNGEKILFGKFSSDYQTLLLFEGQPQQSILDRKKNVYGTLADGRRIVLCEDGSYVVDPAYISPKPFVGTYVLGDTWLSITLEQVAMQDGISLSSEDYQEMKAILQDNGKDIIKAAEEELGIDFAFVITEDILSYGEYSGPYRIDPLTKVLYAREPDILEDIAVGVFTDDYRILYLAGTIPFDRVDE